MVCVATENIPAVDADSTQRKTPFQCTPVQCVLLPLSFLPYPCCILVPIVGVQCSLSVQVGIYTLRGYQQVKMPRPDGLPGPKDMDLSENPLQVMAKAITKIQV